MTKRARPGNDPAKPEDRVRPNLCAYGDVVVYADGRVALVAAFISGSAFGRWIEGGREVGDLVVLPDEPIRCLRAR